jgi:hypothetical protein
VGLRRGVELLSKPQTCARRRTQAHRTIEEKLFYALQALIEKLDNLKYIYREDIRDRITLEKISANAGRIL